MTKQIAIIVATLCALGCGEGLTSSSPTDIDSVTTTDQASYQQGSAGFSPLLGAYRSVTPITYEVDPWCLRYLPNDCGWYVFIDESPRRDLRLDYRIGTSSWMSIAQRSFGRQVVSLGCDSRRRKCLLWVPLSDTGYPSIELSWLSTSGPYQGERFDVTEVSIPDTFYGCHPVGPDATLCIYPIWAPL